MAMLEENGSMANASNDEKSIGSYVITSFPEPRVLSEPSVTFRQSGVPSEQLQKDAVSTSQVIVQQNRHWDDRQKPVKERNLKWYRVLAVAAIVAFFPTGIPAYFMALKLKEEFYEGIQKGDMLPSIRRARLTEKLLLLSFAFCVFVIILTFALVGTRGVHATGDIGRHI